MMRNPYMDYFGRRAPQMYSAEQVQPLIMELRQTRALAQRQQQQIEAMQAKLRAAQRDMQVLQAQVTDLEAELAAQLTLAVEVEAQDAVPVEPIRDQEDFLLAVLPFVDNLERALAADADAESPLHTGIELTLQAFRQTLARMGVEPIAAVGQPFDPYQHEAVALVNDSQQAAGTVATVEQTGYRRHDRLLRPARVTVVAD
jgi:molecular chaperone GrpE